MDGLLLRINYDFLLDLRRQGLEPSDIRMSLRPRDMVVTGYKNIFNSVKNIADFERLYGSIIKDRHYQCYAGPFPVIENIYLKNSNLSFKNNYKWYNITDTRTLTREIQYDSLRKDFFDKEIQRYLQLMNLKFDNYTATVDKSIKIRLNSYMDPCYVDAGYVSPNADKIQIKNI